MNILAYGEDALTLWAIRHKLTVILHTLNDPSTPAKCQALFRPSFGRSGGDNSSQFGEFDFILLAEQRLYLGESKWQRSSEKIQDGVLALRDEQLLRHKLFKFYVEEWAFGQYTRWREFETNAHSTLRRMGITKPIAPTGSLLAANLRTVLNVIQKHYPRLPGIRNVLLFLHTGISARDIPSRAGRDFEVVSVDYAEVAFENFIRLKV
jgi:hypothetical protein